MVLSCRRPYLGKLLIYLLIALSRSVLRSDHHRTETENEMIAATNLFCDVYIIVLHVDRVSVDAPLFNLRRWG